MRATLVDTGPLVAFLNRRDRHHDWAVGALGRFPPPLLTCEAVLSEAIFLVRNLPGGGEAVMNMVERGVVRASFRLEEEAAAVRALLTKYGDLPMDLADACLVRMAEIYAEPTLVTVDTAFRDVYRRLGRKAIPTILPSSVKKSRGRRSR